MRIGVPGEFHEDRWQHSLANHYPTDLRPVSFRCSNRSLARQPLSTSASTPSPRHPSAIPVPSQRYPRIIPAPSPPGKSVFYRILADSGPFSWTSRCSLGAPVGLRHGDLAYRCFRAISAWRSSHLSALRHGDPAQRCLRGIPAWQRGYLSGLRHGHPAQRYLRAILAWQSVLLSGIRHDKLVHRYPRGIILWRSQTGHLPLLVHEIGFFHGR